MNTIVVNDYSNLLIVKILYFRNNFLLQSFINPYSHVKKLFQNCSAEFTA